MSETWNLSRFRIFLTVVEEGSLTRAGSVLGLPQPAVSRHIASLESQCGGQLFTRTGRGVKMTELGERLLPQVEQILEGVETLDLVVSEMAKGPAGEVRIGALPSLYATLIIPLFLHLRESAPGIRLRVFEGSAGQIDQWLTDGYVDIGLPYRYDGDVPGDHREAIKVQSYLMGATDSVASGRETIPFRDLEGLPLVLPGRPSKVRAVLDRHAKACGIRLKVVLEADSTQIQKKVAVIGGGYTILPKHVAEDELRTGQISAARIVEPCVERTVVMEFTTARPASRAVRETAPVLRRIIANLVGQERPAGQYSRD